MTVDELEPIARDATRDALEGYTTALAPYRNSPNLVLGTQIEDEVLTFELYIAGKQPTDAVVLASTKISRSTAEVLEVEVHLRPDV